MLLFFYGRKKSETETAERRKKVNWKARDQFVSKSTLSKVECSSDREIVHGF